MEPQLVGQKRFYGKTRLYVRGLIDRNLQVMDFVEKIQKTMPEIADDRFYSTIYAWCELEILATRVYAELDKQGLVNSQGDTRRLLDDFRKLRMSQLAFSRELGLTPASLANIKALVSRDQHVDVIIRAAEERIEKLSAKPSKAIANGHSED
ncbi:MAG TPA: hypothetical protein VJ728_00990 [Candidatus Binataceae bacterium]|nr:hypothetical protein [Candidatus Binataceae bacterium]